jgi:hypothetical protein
MRAIERHEGAGVPRHGARSGNGKANPSTQGIRRGDAHREIRRDCGGVGIWQVLVEVDQHRAEGA